MKTIIKIIHFLTSWPLLCLILLTNIADVALAAQISDEIGLSYQVEQEHRYTIKEINSQLVSSKFQSVPGRILNLGYMEKAVWIKIDLPEKVFHQGKNWVLSIQNHKLNRVMLFHQYKSDGWQYQKDGIEEAGLQKEQTHREITFQLTNLKEDSPVFLRIEAYYYRIPIQLMKWDTYYASETRRLLSDGIFYGLALAITIYHFFIYLAIRNRAYLSYSVFLAVVMVLYLSGQGWIYAFIFRQLPAPLPHLVHITNPLVGWMLMVLGIQFTKDYLNLSDYPAGLNRIFQILQTLLAVFGFVGVVLIVSGSSFLFARLYNFGFLVVVLTISLCFYSAFHVFRQQQVTAKYYLAATSLQFLISVLMILAIYQLIPINFSWKILQSSAVIEMLIFSFGLSRQVKKIEEENLRIGFELQKTQEQVIKHLNTIN